jgi:basic membrane protein A
MKKIVFLILLLSVIVFAAACASNPTADPEINDLEEPAAGADQTYELALVTDSAGIDDKSFNEGAWAGIKKYAEANHITYNYYQPVEVSDASYVQAISTAVKNGAKLVVCPGKYFEVAVYEAQYQYPDVKFVIIDGEPRAKDFNTSAMESNVHAIYFAEQEAGFLAGYAVVRNGFTKLGFMGGWAVPAVVRFGYGFIAGADYAAQEKDITGVEIIYRYTNTYHASPEIQSEAAAWYNAGTEMIFGCGGALGESVMAAAEPIGAYVIGVDIDQSWLSDTVVISAVKNLEQAVYSSIEDFYNGEFPGGKISRLNAANKGIGLSMASSKFEFFNQEIYDVIYAKLAAGEIEIPNESSALSAEELSTEKVQVTVIE